MSFVQLSAQEVVEDRTFTDLRHTKLDSQAIRFMVACVFLALEEASTQLDSKLPILLHQPSAEGWTQRIVITQPARLQSHAPLTVVGFFGIRNRGGDLSLAQKLDRQLIPELSAYEALLAYATVALPSGNFGNLVLFTSTEGKNEWGKSEKHAEAVRLLTPDYYAAVRLYNGVLAEGIANPDALQLLVIKYYDYGDCPIWRAVRHLDNGAGI